MSASVKTFGQLTQGTVINSYHPTIGSDTNYAVLAQVEERFGKFTILLNLFTFEKEKIMQHTEVKNQWSIVKEN